MNAAIRTSRRGARIRSSPCSTSGKLVVAPSSTALTVPIAAFDATDANVVRPSSDTRERAEVDRSPPRTNGMNTATKTTSGRTTRARVQTTPGPTRAVAAIAASASAHATSTRPRRGGVETPTSVIPANPTIFARGSRRWIGLAGSPATPVACSACDAHRRTPTAATP